MRRTTLVSRGEADVRGRIGLGVSRSIRIRFRIIDCSGVFPRSRFAQHRLPYGSVDQVASNRILHCIKRKSEVAHVCEKHASHPLSTLRNARAFTNTSLIVISTPQKRPHTAQSEEPPVIPHTVRCIPLTTALMLAKPRPARQQTDCPSRISYHYSISSSKSNASALLRQPHQPFLLFQATTAPGPVSAY